MITVAICSYNRAKHLDQTLFGLRLLRADETIWYAPEAIVHHPVSRERATKDYFRKWYYPWGRTTVRLDTLPGECPRILDVPRFLCRQLAEEIVKMTMRGLTPERVLHELRARQIVGAIVESRRRHRNSEGTDVGRRDDPSDDEVPAPPTSRQSNG